jgi:uncharacterized protein with FMN-binding domain/Pyruvate/2-oxoacid:ferredoxin oxidoreductase delta subunit
MKKIDWHTFYKKKSFWVRFLRFALQVVAFFLLPGLFIQAFLGIGTLIQDICVGSYSGLASALFPTVLLLLVTILFGRFFCGYLCAFGSLSDGMTFIGHDLFGLKTRMPEKVDQILKYMKYAVLLAFFIAFFFTLTPMGDWDPWSSFGTLFTIPMSAENYKTAFTTLLPGTLILLAILIVEIFYQRFFCRYLCPMGALFSLASLLRITKIKKERSHCGICRICANACPMGIPTYKYDVIKSGECIDCLECALSCPRSNPEVTPLPKKAGYWAMSVLSVSTIGLYYLGNIAVNNIFATATIANGTAYADGVYQGSGQGFRGTVTVEVTISGGKITSITTVSESDDAQYDNAFSTLVPEIIANQSTSGVNTVSNATYSSKGILAAVSDALSQASTSSSSTLTSTSSASTASTSKATSTSVTVSVSTSTSSSTATTVTYKDGTYQGSGTGYHNGTITLSVTISGGKITTITTVSESDSSSDSHENHYQTAFDTIIPKIIANQSTSGVNTVSGCTFSSNGILTAVKAALALAAA